MEQKRICTRAEQRVEDTWDLSTLYVSDEAYDKETQVLKDLIQNFKGLQGSLGKGAESFLHVLSSYEKMIQIYRRQTVYSNQRYHQDTTNAFYQKMSGENQIVGIDLDECMSWLEPELLELDEETLASYYKEVPELEDYRRFIYQIVRRKDHVLDVKTEELLSRAGDLSSDASNIYSMFNNADIKFPDVTDSEGKVYPLTQGCFISYLESEDRVLRKNAFEALYSVYRQNRNFIAATYYANAKQAHFFAKEHNYDGAMDQALFNTEIPVEVYHNLIETIHSRLPLMYRYVRLRKKILDVPELHMYDVYTSITECPLRVYSFDEAKEIVKRGLAPLGEDYQALLQQGFDNRWIDVYENVGKRTGAYSWGAYGSNPFVLLNFHGTLDNVFTLAHEMGHSLHTYHSNKAQRCINAGYRIFVAEVASTCNEALLIHDLLNRTEDKLQRKFLINHFLDDFKGTMYRQTMFAEFEMITHDIVKEGGALTSEQLCNIYYDLNKKYFGEDMVSDPEIAFEWERIPHFYTPFYVYQYATGFAAAIAISSKILAGEPGIVEKYKKFLSGGSSMTPIDLLKICDVDMSSPKPVEEALDVFEKYLKMMEEE